MTDHVITSYSIHYTKLYDLLADDDQELRLEEARAELAEWQQAEAFLQQKGQWLAQLERDAHLLREDPQNLGELQQACQQAEQQLAQARRQSFALDDLQARLPYFGYQDAEAMRNNFV